MKKLGHQMLYQYLLPYGPLFSPNGRFSAYGVKQADQDTNGNTFRIHVFDLESGDDQTVNDGWNCPFYLWDADGALLLARKEADGKTTFMEWNPVQRNLTPAFQIEKNCTGAKLLGEDSLLLPVREPVHSLSGEIPGEPPGRKQITGTYTVIDELPYWANGAGFTGSMRTRLYLYSRHKKTLTLISNETDDVILYEPGYEDPDTILYAACPFEGVYNDKPGICRYHVNTQTAEILLEPGNFYVRLLCSTDSAVLFSGSRGETYGKYQYDGFYKLAEEDDIPPKMPNRPTESLPDRSPAAWKLAASHDACAGLCSIISDTLTGMGQKYKVSGGRLYFLSTIDDQCGIYCLNGNSITKIPTGCTVVESFDLLKDCDGKEQFLFCGSNGDLPSELWRLSGKERKQLTGFQEFLKQEYLLSDREEFCFTNRAGIRLRGWVMRPLAKARSAGPEKSPAVFCIHGGPRSGYGGVYYHEMQLLAAAGYFVCFYNGRGSDSRGNVFGNINGRYGSEDMDDLMDFTDQALIRYPEIDAARLGLSGGSYGGYLVNWVLGHSRRFAAAVSQRSISNWITQEALSDIGYYYVPDQAGASLLAGEAGRLWDNSPLKYADQIETPLLLLHSDQDYRCGIQEALQMFYVLKRRRIPCKTVIFHGENHELNKNGKPENRIARIELILEWMGKYLNC